MIIKDKTKNGRTNRSEENELSSGAILIQSTFHVSIKDRYPEIAKLYDNKKNRSPVSECFSENETEDYWWNCENGHSYLRTAYQQIKKKGICPDCIKERRVISGYNDLLTRFPFLQDIWDYEKNGIEPSKMKSFSSHGTYYFKCSAGHSYKYDLDEQIVHGTTCMVCIGIAVQKNLNSVKAIYPQIIHEWSPNNIVGPDDVIYNTSVSYIWRCKKCGYEYFNVPHIQSVDTEHCPVCLGRIVVPGINDILTLHPEIAKDYSLNNKVPIEQINTKIKNYKEYLWNCTNCGGEYEYPLAKRLVRDDSCPYCSNRKVLTGFNDLETMKPELAKEFSPKNKASANAVLYNSKISFKWICPHCGGEYQHPLNRRSVGDDSCPYCSNRIVLPGFNDLETMCPDLAREFSPKNKVSANAILYNSKLSFKWICPHCGGEYQHPLDRRSVGDDSCPYCSNRIVLPGFNDLETMCPDLAREFSPKNKVSANAILYNSKLSFKWICPHCEGEYQHPLDRRSVGDDSCPYCANRKVLPGYNSFAARHPALLNEWSYRDNYLIDKDPNKMMDNNTHPVWWVCSNHKTPFVYPMSISNRVLKEFRGQVACPKCKGYRRRLRYFG